MQALFLIHANNVSAVAVTDVTLWLRILLRRFMTRCWQRHNRLVANFSAIDLSHLNLDRNIYVPTTFKSLLLPLRSFLSRVNAHPPVAVTLGTTLETVVSGGGFAGHACQSHARTQVAQMAMFHMHRVWIVDASYQPIGIITAFDVLKLFVAQAP